MNIISTIKHIISGVDIDSLHNKIAELESNLKRIKEDSTRKTAEITRLENKTTTLNEDLTREQNKCSIAAWNSAFYKDKIVIQICSENFQILNSDSFVTHLTGHLFTF